MTKRLSKRLLSLLLVFAMVIGFVPVLGVSATGTQSDDQVKLQFEEIDASGYTMDDLEQAEGYNTTTEQDYEESDIVRVSIVLETASTLDSGFSTLNIAGNAQAKAYRDALQEEQAEMTAAIEQAIGGELDVAWNLTLAANIISANIEFGQMETIEALPGVKEVVLETLYEPQVCDTEEEANPNMATSGEMIGTSAAYASGYTGAGSRIAVIDTGIDTDHQSFAAAGYNYSLAYQAGLAGMDLQEYMAQLDLLDATKIGAVLDQLNIQDVDPSALYISNKIPFAFNYVDEDYDVTHDNDRQGEHGSHVEGIAAANAFIANADGPSPRRWILPWSRVLPLMPS